MNISTSHFPRSISMTVDQLKELNQNQFRLLGLLRSQGREDEASVVERIAILTNRCLVLRHSTFDMPQIDENAAITHSIKVRLIQPGLLGGNTSKIIIRNYTKHRITFKSSYDQSGSFDESPSTLIPSTGLSQDGTEVKVTQNSAKAFLTGFTLGIPALVKLEKQATSISLTVETKQYYYTVALGAIEFLNPHTNCAGIEIRGGEFKLGKDKETINGVDVGGHVADVRELCREKHCGPSDKFHTFYEDARSSDPTEGFTVKCFFADLANASFYFEFHPLDANGHGYREVTVCK